MTKAEARAAILWFQKRVGITDWKIELDFQDSVPDWVRLRDCAATAWRRPTRKEGGIWLSATRAQEDSDSLLMLLFHECLHIAEEDAGLPNPSTGPVEYLWNRLAEICELAYLAETKRSRK